MERLILLMHAMALFSSFLLVDALQIHYIVPIKHSVDTEKQLGITLLQAFFPPHPTSLHFYVYVCFEGLFSSRQSYQHRGVLRISSDREDRMGANIETTQNP